MVNIAVAKRKTVQSVYQNPITYKHFFSLSWDWLLLSRGYERIIYMTQIGKQNIKLNTKNPLLDQIG